MNKVRINDLARELEVKSRQILNALEYLGLAEGKTHSSFIEAPEAERVRAYLELGHHGLLAQNASKIDLSSIHKPGDVMKAILARKQQAERESQHPQLPRVVVGSPGKSPAIASPSSRDGSPNSPKVSIPAVAEPGDPIKVGPPASVEHESSGQQQIRPMTVVARPPESNAMPMKPGESAQVVTLKGECFELVFLSQQDNLYDRAGALYKYQVEDLTDKARGKRLVSVYRFGIDELSGRGRDAQLDAALLNAIRRSFDAGTLSFDAPYDKRRYQEISLEIDSLELPRKSGGQDIQDLIKHAAYWLAFRLSKNPGYPISFESSADLEYLGVSPLEVQRYVHLMAQRGLLEKVLGSLGRPTHKLIDAYEIELKQAATAVKATGSEDWDVFISHATEDKEEIARPLAEALRERGVRVWYDEFALTVGDSLRKRIDEGLAKSRFGVAILSPSFFSKHWPEQELNGLAAREVDGVKVILPVWHKVSRVDVLKYSPILADKLASSTARGLQAVVGDLLAVIKK